MGKKKKNKGSFDGKNAYDFLSKRFDETYRPHMSDRESSEVYNRKRDRDFQRYLMTGEKNTGWSRVPHKDDKRFKKGFEDKLFEAGIPPSQWKYYAKKAGITNVNSKGDARKLIDVYNRDERYQGETFDREIDTSTPKPNPVAQEFKDKYVDKVIEKVIPSQSVGNVTGGDDSIVSPINQDNDISITGNRNNVSQDNSIAQMMKDMRKSLRFAY